MFKDKITKIFELRKTKIFYGQTFQDLGLKK